MKTEFLSETLGRRKVKKNNKITSTTSLILTLNGVEMDVNQSGRMQERQLDISEKNAATAELQARNQEEVLNQNAPLSLKGGILYKNGKPIDKVTQDGFINQIKNIPNNQITEKGVTVQIDPSKTIINPRSDGSYALQLTETGTDPVTYTRFRTKEQVQSILDNMNTVTLSTGTNTTATGTVPSGTEYE
jgi:hypothetical protein